MNIKSIIIELELEENDDKNHATKIEFKDGQWIANGSMYSRIAGSLHEIWKLLRGVKERR